MFFRREKPHHWTFDERISDLRKLGFEAKALGGGRIRVLRGGLATDVDAAPNGEVRIGKAGVLIGDEIGVLTNGGFQMFVRTPSGIERPALAPQLKALHAFDEDLREAVGLTSLYNQGLGTTSEAHMYDRVVARDEAPAKHPWEKA